MSNQELFQAMNMFKEGVRDLSKARTLNEANAQVKQIRESEGSEMQKNQALQQLGQEFAMRMLGAGGSASDVQIGMQVMQPKIYSPQDRYSMAVASGDKEGAQAALGQLQELDTAAQAGNMAQLKSQQQFAEKQQQQQFAQQDKLMGLRMAGQQKPKQQQGDVEFGTNVEVALKESNKLKNLVNKVGNWEVMNPKASAQLNSASYQLAINYAKIVDPASVAREGEVAAAQKYLIPMGATTRNSVTLAAIDKYQKTIKEYVQARQRQKNNSAPTQQPDMDDSQGVNDDISKWLE